MKKNILWGALLLPVAACSTPEVEVGTPDLQTREVIVVEGTAPCPPGYGVIIAGDTVWCAFGANPATPPPTQAEPGGGGPGSEPSDPGDDDDDADDGDPPTPAEVRFQARQRIRNKQCTAGCIEAQMPSMEECFKWNGYSAPPDGYCPYGASTADPARCPGFWELCVYNHVNGHGTHAPTESCLDGNGDLVLDDPTCQVELGFCISTWEQNLNDDDWLGCLMNEPTSNACIQQCFEDWSIDGSPCSGFLDGDSGSGTVEGGVMEGTWCTNGQSSIDCSAVGFVKCLF